MDTNDKTTAYQSVAPLYDDLMQHVNYDEWFKHYMALISLSRIAVTELLELGCGTGIMTQRFADYLEVTAVDASESMLRIARRKSYEKNVHFFHADLRDFDLGRQFPVAVAIFDVLNCAKTYEDFSLYLANIHRHLLPKGRLIFDVNTPYAFESQLFDEDVYDDLSGYRHRWRGKYDPDTQLIRVRMQFELDGERFEEVHVQRAHTRAEISAALRSLKFKRVQFYDANTFSEPTQRTDRWLISATKY
ncbi:MAG: class I SAM-dependent methyltransferase [Bradymonadales bacterium]|jgi:SAM-dependent methyltransferase